MFLGMFLGMFPVIFLGTFRDIFLDAIVADLPGKRQVRVAVPESRAVPIGNGGPAEILAYLSKGAGTSNPGVRA